MHKNFQTMTFHSRLRLLQPLLAFMLVAASLVGVAQAEPAGRHYQNATFGFSLDLSPGLIPDYRSVTSPEGITLTSPDGKVVVNIFGAWNEADRPPAALVAEFKRDLPDASFTYEWHRPTAAVLSGYQAGDIFYVRIAMSPDRSRVAVLSMIYAPDLKRQLDPLVTRLSQSLSIR